MEETLGATELVAALGSSLHRAVILADRGGYIRFWNAGAEALFGHRSIDALGKRADLIVPVEYREMHWAGFNRTIGSRWPGAESWGVIEGLHSSGALVALEVLLTPMLDADERVDSVLAMFRRPIG